jgi:hypothetical protein
VKSSKIPASRHLLVDDLARKMEATESGREPIQALAYRVQARMLRRALLNHPQTAYDGHDPAVWTIIEDALVNRCFETTGQLPTMGGRDIKLTADALIARCRLSSCR